MKKHPKQNAYDLNDLLNVSGLTELGRASCQSCCMVYGWMHVDSLHSDTLQCGAEVFKNQGACPYCGGRLAFERLAAQEKDEHVD